MTKDKPSIKEGEMVTQERRKYPRISHAFMMHYRAQSEDHSRWSITPLRDLSLGGARFIAERPFRVGEKLELRLRLPIKQESVPLSAKVVWMRPSRWELSELGVQFGSLGPEIHKILSSVITEHLPIAPAR